jgi:high-affinity Fe2+/Pb2+ permease
VSLAIGIVLVLVGATFASWGAYRLSRPRRRADIEWIRSNPRSNLTLGGIRLGFDRSGALASVLAGAVGILLGLAVLMV